jgi:starch synthase
MGVLNGVDTTEWNPRIDTHLALPYDATTVEEGKRACKAALQAELGLTVDPDTLLFGMVSRMADQKGFDLIAARIEDILKANVQFAFLGTGDRRYEELVTGLAEDNPGRVSASLVFNEGLAHRIEAGSDAYLMPSRFEPCGLNQQYSLLYGTIPIVHRTGGLADTVVDTRPETIADGTANGFVFDRYDPNSFLTSVWQCVGCYQHDRPTWNQLIHNGMREDRSWKKSAAHYLDIYRRAIGWLK